MKRKPRATISGGFGVGLWLKLMFTFSVVKVHQAESEIHHLYLKRGYVTLGKLLSQAVQPINIANIVTCIVAFLICKEKSSRQMVKGLAVWWKEIYKAKIIKYIKSPRFPE